MTSGEPYEFGEDTRHLAEGLRRLAQDVQTPADILPSVLARSEHCLPAHRIATRRWFTHPALWGPALAVASFVAGVLVAPWQLNTPLQTVSTEKHQVVVEQPTAPPPASLGKQERALPEAAPMPQQESAQDRRARRAAKPATSALSAPAEPEAASIPLLQQRGDMAPTALRYLGTSEDRERLHTVTVSLPLALYERLLERAEGDADRLAQMVREAIETYARTRDKGKE